MVTTRSHLARPPPIQWKQRDDNALVEQTAGLLVQASVAWLGWRIPVYSRPI
jgi:hypothetical protein